MNPNITSAIVTTIPYSWLLVLFASMCSTLSVAEERAKQVYFGELHIHSGWSFDAYLDKVRSSPEDAYRYNTGKAIRHANGDMIQIRQPLDFMAVTDHAEYMGFTHLYFDPEHPLYNTKLAAIVRGPNGANEFWRLMDVSLSDPDSFPNPPQELINETLRTNWQHYVDLAERYYRPGEFTTFVGYEWSALPEFQNLHRNIIFKGLDVPEMPFSSLESLDPADLWDWMDKARDRGSDLLAIPHNSNLSNGQMFPAQKSDGSEIDKAYARQRMRNEPLVEVTQIKGTSETHPALSPLDEWADFELLNTLIARHDLVSEPKGSYVRDAYLTGLSFEARKSFNPYKFGLIGSSDGHNASSPIDEDSYHGEFGMMDGTPESRRGSNVMHPVAAAYSASGLAAVWAIENTREAIFDALKRKETFATTGTRIKARIFGAWDFPEDIMTRPDWSSVASRYGVPMGADLPALMKENQAPMFAVWAMKDPASAWLQRAQIIKGWIKDGEPKEQVFDVICSDDLKPDPSTHRCPDNGAQVNLSSCDYSKDVGDVILAGTWKDPNFDPDYPAFYYLRVLENPTCRWSTWEANRYEWDLLSTVPATIQERAWSSPIWYVPQ